MNSLGSVNVWGLGLRVSCCKFVCYKGLNFINVEILFMLLCVFFCGMYYLKLGIIV